MTSLSSKLASGLKSFFPSSKIGLNYDPSTLKCAYLTVRKQFELERERGVVAFVTVEYIVAPGPECCFGCGGNEKIGASQA